MSNPKRRELLATTALALILAPTAAIADIIHGALPWTPGQADPPKPVQAGPWRYFTAQEGAAIEALVDRLIPTDPETPGGKDTGCAVFIDRQLAAPYGSSEDYYMIGPFHPGTKEQGDQSPLTPARHYRLSLAALDKHCTALFSGAVFAALTDQQKDAVIAGLESGSLKLEGADSKKFFDMLLIDTRQGFFADPIYGGNKDMAAWKMIGFPGSRYDYRDWVHRHNERYPLPPMSIADHPNWKQ